MKVLHLGDDPRNHSRRARKLDTERKEPGKGVLISRSPLRDHSLSPTKELWR